MYFSKRLKINSNDIAAKNNLANLESKFKQIKEAEKLYKKP